MAEAIECTLGQFQTYVQKLKQDMPSTEAYKRDKAGFDKVMTSLETALRFSGGATCKYLVALEAGKVIAVLLMQKDTTRWLINDVVSIGGGGGLLAEAAVRAARKDMPGCEVSLVSETARSTEYWSKLGFVSKDSGKDRSVGMYLPGNAQLKGKSYGEAADLKPLKILESLAKKGPNTVEVLEPGKAIPSGRGYVGIAKADGELLFPYVDSCCAIAIVLEDGTMIGGHMGAQWPGEASMNYDANAKRIVSLMDANRRRLGGKTVTTVITLYAHSSDTWQEAVSAAWSMWGPENVLDIDTNKSGGVDVIVSATGIVVRRLTDNLEKKYPVPDGYLPLQQFV